MNVSLVTSADGQLEELLRACDAQVSSINLRELSALANPRAKQPDAVVVDQGDGAALPAALAAIRRQHPSTGILLVLARLDGALMLEAMRAGINECVAQPLTLDELKSALKRITDQHPAAKRGEMFAFIGAKGGVGATTMAVNAAAFISKLRPSSTLLIDLHLTHGDAGVYLGAEPRFTVVDALENMHRMDATFLRSLVAPTKSGVHLLASSAHPLSVPLDAARVRALLELAAQEYPYVVLDVPRDAVMLDVLAPASAVVVVSNQELASVRSAGRITASMEQQYTKERVSVVVTRYTEGANVDRKDIERVVGRSISCLIPNRDGNYRAAVDAQAKGHPLVLHSQGHLAKAISGFTRDLAGIPVEQEKSAKSSGLLSRVFRPALRQT